jgi:short-subunit dehydrogenase
VFNKIGEKSLRGGFMLPAENNKELKMKLKQLSEQTIVITGATSGIGLTTARMAAEAGAKLILVARNENALRELVSEINASGGQAIYSVADVADEAALREAARKAEEKFNGFDTWVNNAGGSVYGRIMDVPTEDLRRLFETNVWGVVNGSKVAVENLRNRGGAIINVGSEVSDSPIPLQGMYSSSKHAVKGFTDALRMELEADGLPISVTLIKPTAIHTPFPENAKNYLPYEPQLPPPLYAPELVAEAILHCAENQTRDFFVGEMAKLHSSMALNMPRLFEKMNESMIDTMQNAGEPAKTERPDGLYQTNSKLKERGAKDRFVLEESVYQRAKIHPIIATSILIGSGLALAAVFRGRKTKYKETGLHRINRRSFQSNSASIREHMEVVGSDGQHIGTVDEVEGNRIKLTKTDSSAGGRHHFISMNLVESIGDKIRLNKTAAEIRRYWQDDNYESLTAGV